MYAYEPELELEVQRNLSNKQTKQKLKYFYASLEINFMVPLLPTLQKPGPIMCNGA